MFEKLSTKMFHLVNMQSAAVRAGDAKPRIRICLRIGPRLRIQPEVVIPPCQRESQLFDKKLPPKKSRNCSVAETREKMKPKERSAGASEFDLLWCFFFVRTPHAILTLRTGKCECRISLPAAFTWHSSYAAWPPQRNA